MPVLIRRIIVYSATACALIYLTIVLQNIFTDLLERAGLTDAITLGGLPDLISRLPIFADMRADITVLAIGLFGWLGIRYDQHKADKWSGNKVRALFLAGLTVAFTLRILPELLLIVRNVETLAQNDLPI